MEAVNITIKYEPAATTRDFGHYILSFTGLEGTQYSVKLKFGFDELRSIAQDTSSIAFDFLVFSLSVYNAQGAIFGRRMVQKDEIVGAGATSF